MTSAIARPACPRPCATPAYTYLDCRAWMCRSLHAGAAMQALEKKEVRRRKAFVALQKARYLDSGCANPAAAPPTGSRERDTAMTLSDCGTVHGTVLCSVCAVRVAVVSRVGDSERSDS